jgi:tetratricopeptide (TPR) repeat protein
MESDTHRRVLALIGRGQADQDALQQRLTPEERAALGELHAWSPKDHVAHNNFWRQDAVLRLNAALGKGEPPDTERDEAQTLQINDRVFMEQRATPWADLVAETTRLRAETAALIPRFKADELTDRDRYPWQRGSMMGLIFVNWYDHPVEHWADLYLRRHEPDRALELRQAALVTVQEAYPDDRRMYSFMTFKLGEVYARTGRLQQAIDAVSESVRANPSLLGWAREDAALEPLRALPEFQAIVR